ncbi:MAG: protein kinase [Gemmatimonadaceae bacterium]|nr:protein kinase [Gemmatimonadaceae bacterium]
MSDVREQLASHLGDRYDIQRELGGGGMSRVFLAIERSLNRQVVIKVLAPELGRDIDAERFQQEIQTSALLQHPQVVPVYAAGAAGDLRYYVMPYIAGESLDATLRREGKLAPDEVARLMAPIARALAYAHRQGIVHRDVKPANILLSEGEPMLADFGIAKVRRSDGATGLTSAGMSLGTVTYMPPEQVTADPTLDGRADVYSLAAVAFEMLAGAPPFKGSPAQQMSAHVVQPPPALAPLVPDAPHELVQAVEQGLAKEATARPDAEEFARMMDRARLRTGERPPSSVQIQGRQPRWAVPALVVLVVSAALAVWALNRPTVGNAAPVVAVLPFELIGVPEDAYLSAGMTDEVTTGLSQLSGLRVLSRSTVQAMAAGGLAPSDYRSRADVAALVEGSVQRAGDRLRITARLVSTEDGSSVWTARYERGLSDLFATQREIGDAVANALLTELGMRTGPRAGEAYAADAAAYDRFLRGRFALQTRGEASLREAIREFSEAARLDPRFARAHAGIAEAAALLPLYGPTAVTDIADTVRATARRALALDASVASAHVAIGLVERGLGRWQESAAALRTAVQLDSASAESHQQLGELQFILGDFAGSRAAFERATLLEPTVDVILAEFAWSLVLTDALDSASRVLARTSGREATEPFTPFSTAMLAERRGDAAGAVTHLRRAAASAPIPFFEGALIRGLRLAGETNEAVQRESALRASGDSPAIDFALSVGQLTGGNGDAVFPGLQRAAAARDPFALLLPLRVWWYDGVRADPRFAEFASALGLPASAWRNASAGGN